MASPFRKVLVGWLLWTTLCWAIIGLLVAPLLPGGWLAVLLLAILTSLPLRTIARGFGGSAYPSAGTRMLVLRPFWYGLLLIPLLAIGGLLGLLVGLLFGEPMMVGRWVMGSVGVIAITIGLLGYLGSRRLVVRHLEARFESLPEGLEGRRIAKTSDLHVGPQISPKFLQRVLERVNESAPDLIAITGDQVDDYARDVDRFAEVFSGLAAPLGLFAIAGNH